MFVCNVSVSLGIFECLEKKTEWFILTYWYGYLSSVHFSRTSPDDYPSCGRIGLVTLKLRYFVILYVFYVIFFFF